MNHPEHRSEQYYEELWNSPNWGTTGPNQDERLRYQAIAKLIEQSVLPRVSVPLRILDLGCGRGWLTSLTSRYGLVTGIDPTTASIQRARVLFPQHEFYCMSAQDLIDRALTAKFHLIVCSEVIEHVPDSGKRDLLACMFALLTTPGFAILTTPRAELWDSWKKRGIEEQPIEQWISEKGLAELGREVGFEVGAKTRVFLPGFVYDLPSRIATHPYLSQLGWLEPLRYYCAFYQVVLFVKRPDR